MPIQTFSSLGTLSLAFSRSTNTQCSSFWPSLYFTINTLKANNAYVVFCLAWKRTVVRWTSTHFLIFFQLLRVTGQRYAPVVTTARYITLVLESWYQNAVSPLLMHSPTLHRSVVGPIVSSGAPVHYLLDISRYPLVGLPGLPPFHSSSSSCFHPLLPC